MIRYRLSAMMMAAMMTAANTTGRLLAKAPINFLSDVNMISGMTTNGMPKLRHTWLRTRVAVGSSPIMITIIDGSTVNPHRSQTGMLLFTKPYMMI